MKTPKNMAQIKKRIVDETINKLSDQPHWNTDIAIIEDTLVNITFRAPRSLKAKLEKQAKVNKSKGDTPNTVTDFLLKAIHQYIDNNPEEFES